MEALNFESATFGADVRMADMKSRGVLFGR